MPRVLDRREVHDYVGTCPKPQLPRPLLPYLGFWAENFGSLDPGPCLVGCTDW
jgi:hypothetical protein